MFSLYGAHTHLSSYNLYNKSMQRNKQELIILASISSDDFETTVVLSTPCRRESAPLYSFHPRQQFLCCPLFIPLHMPLITKSPRLKSSLTSTHASRSCLTACHCYSIEHYIKKSEISLAILPCARKQEQLINLRRQSHPLNIKYHPSPGTTLMRRK